MRDAFLGEDCFRAPADPEKGPAAQVSSLVPEISAPSVSTARNGTVAVVRLQLPRLGFPALRSVAQIWVLTLGQAATAESPVAREGAPPPDGSVGITTAVCPTPPCPPVARLAKIRHHGRTCVTPHFPRPRLYDPNDDVASDDPNDDDDGDWEDPTADDNSNDSAIAWLPEMVRYLTASEVGSAPAWAETPSSPFLTPHRLRC
jgi:hypothetical protein